MPSGRQIETWGLETAASTNEVGPGGVVLSLGGIALLAFQFSALGVLGGLEAPQLDTLLVVAGRSAVRVGQVKRVLVPPFLNNERIFSQ